MANKHDLTATAKTLIPDYADDGLREKSNRIGCCKGDYLRDLIFMDLYGQTYGEHVADSRRAIMGVKGLSMVVRSSGE